MNLRDLIAEQLNLTAISPAEQDLFLARVEDVILREVTLEVLEKLPTGDREELEGLISSADDPTILSFIRSKLNDFDNLQKQVADNILKQFLA
ncbi:MAG: hypothetical protein K8Q91_00615 [Candidatus Vogelbacteria bacterium]|nr:hypothetical protein [Candidatus Vogelbacteria bacterium]